MLETQTLDMNKYREQKDKLEYEAMCSNPETAYLVSNEEFDRQLEELAGRRAIWLRWPECISNGACIT